MSTKGKSTLPVLQGQMKSGKKSKALSSMNTGQIAAPVASTSQFKQKGPKVSTVKNGFVVQHCERFATIAGSVAFAVSSFYINPGDIYLFPWLSNLAIRFESYKFKSLRFLYRNKTSTSSTGDVTLAVDYDAADSAPFSTIQMENWADSVNGSPWQDIVMVCSMNNVKTQDAQRYIRHRPLASNLDVKTYDVGNFHIATEGQASTATVGYLYVEYEVELITPQLEFNDMCLGGKITNGGTVSAANPLGSAATADTQALGITIGTTSNITLHFPGNYVLTFLTTSGSVISAFGASAGTGAGVIDNATVINSAATAASGYIVVSTTIMDAVVTITATATSLGTTVVYVSANPSGSNA